MEKHLSIIEYYGVDYQIVEMSNASEPGSVGEPGILYKCMDRFGGIKDIMDHEIAAYRKVQHV